jgi:VanZ family protein
MRLTTVKNQRAKKFKALLALKIREDAIPARMPNKWSPPGLKPRVPKGPKGWILKPPLSPPLRAGFASGVVSRARLIKLWLPVLICMGIIFYASSLPAKDIPPLFPFQDIVFHISSYLVLGVFYARVLKNSRSNMTRGKLILFTVVFGIFYGITDELHQAFVPGRIVSGFDLFLDGAGSFAGSLVYSWLR